jgi:hypothetical protein
MYPITYVMKNLVHQSLSAMRKKEKHPHPNMYDTVARTTYHSRAPS